MRQVRRGFRGTCDCAQVGGDAVVLHSGRAEQHKGGPGVGEGSRGS